MHIAYSLVTMYCSFNLYYDYYDEIVGEAEFLMMFCLKARMISPRYRTNNDELCGEWRIRSDFAGYVLVIPYYSIPLYSLICQPGKNGKLIGIE